MSSGKHIMVLYLHGSGPNVSWQGLYSSTLLEPSCLTLIIALFKISPCPVRNTWMFNCIMESTLPSTTHSMMCKPTRICDRARGVGVLSCRPSLFPGGKKNASFAQFPLRNLFCSCVRGLIVCMVFRYEDMQWKIYLFCTVELENLRLTVGKICGTAQRCSNMWLLRTNFVHTACSKNFLQCAGLPTWGNSVVYSAPAYEPRPAIHSQNGKIFRCLPCMVSGLSLFHLSIAFGCTAAFDGFSYD